MQYIVQSGADDGLTHRDVFGTADQALRAAQNLTARGDTNVVIIEGDERLATVADFARRLHGHSLTRDQLALIKKTSDVLMRDDTVAASLFYERLFTIAPGVRPLFAADMAAQKAKLLETLVALVEHATMERSSFRDIIRGLGRRHVNYGALPDHYGPVGVALLHSLASLLGPRFTPDVEAAWTALYTDVATAMAAASGG